MSTTPVLSANFSGLTAEINRVFSVMSGKTPVLSGPSGATGPTGLTGSTGPTGPSGATGIGIGTTLKGVWSSGGNYSLNTDKPDAVTYNGSLYICIQAVSGSIITPDQDTTNWLRYVSQGATGPTGLQGTTGPSGATGIGIGTTLQGVWANGATYRSRNGVSADAVTYNGSFFVCIQSVPFVSTIPPDVDTANWLLYVKMGVTGATGSISAVGSDGQFLYNSNGILAASAAITYRATGPTGPEGQATGPIGQPTLQVGAYMLPTADATYDLGATGIQFKDVHFSGSLYNNAAPFSLPGLTYRATGPTGPTGGATGPAPNPTLQVGLHLVPDADLAYDLGATGLRFRDIHVGGSTIYLGDSLSIKATTEGALTVTNKNTAATVNLVTPTGFNGGIISGAGVTSAGSSPNYYGSNTFSRTFSDAPIVIATSASITNTNTKLIVNDITTTGFKAYSDVNTTAYNWIATPRTDYPFSFYDITQPIANPTVGYTTLVFQINTNNIVRAGTPPYTVALVNTTATPDDSRPININTGTQTITFSALTIGGTEYVFIVTVVDSTSTLITSDELVYNTLTDNLAGVAAESIISTGTITHDTVASGAGSIEITLTTFNPNSFVQTPGVPPYSVEVKLTYKGVYSSQNILLDTWEPDSTTHTFTSLYPGYYGITYTLTDLYTSVTPQQTISDIGVDGPVPIDITSNGTPVFLNNYTGDITHNDGSGGSVTFYLDLSKVTGGVAPYTLNFTLYNDSNSVNFDIIQYPITSTGVFTLTNIDGSNLPYTLSWSIEDTDVSISNPVTYNYTKTSTGQESISSINIYPMLSTPSITFNSKTTTGLSYYLSSASGGSGSLTHDLQYKKATDSTYSSNGDSGVISGLDPDTEYNVQYVVTDTMTNITKYSGVDTQTTDPLVAPEVSTDDVTLDGGGLSCAGTIISSGSGYITASGMCFSGSNTSPTIDADYTSLNTLAPNDILANEPTITSGTYYVRAYATNSDGLTGYGSPSTVTYE